MEITSLRNGLIAAQAQQATAKAAVPGSSASNTASSNTISSTNFLTFLVTQLKNQDPNHPKDPTQYVTQLVGVNSLEQLIDVNKQLTSLGGHVSATTTSTASPATGV